MTLLEFMRRSNGWTQAALASALGEGFTASAISLMESGRLKPSTRQSVRLAEQFARSPEELLQPVGDPPPNE